MNNEYNKQAEDFLAETNTSLSLVLIGTYPRFSETPTDNYSVTLSNIKHSYTFTFSDTIHNTEARQGKAKPYGRVTIAESEKYRRDMQKKHRKPSAYDILACMSGHSYGESFEDFCGKWGYDTDSRKALETYLAVQDEQNNLQRLFTPEELEKLSEIN